MLLKTFALLTAFALCNDTAIAQIKLGVAGPMSGQVAEYGLQMKEAAEQAISDINGAGGLLGQRVELIIGDDGNDPKQAVSVANRFASEGVKFVAGHFNSSSSVAASSVYHEAGIIQITPGSQIPRFTDERPGPGIFRVSPRDDEEGEIVANFVRQNFSGKKIAFVRDSSRYSREIGQQLQRSLPSNLRANSPGFDLSTDGTISSDLSATSASSGDAIFVAADPESEYEARKLLNEITHKAFSGPVILSSTLSALSTSPTAVSGLSGFLGLLPVDPKSNNRNKDLTQKLVSIQSINPKPIAYRTYAAFQVYYEAAEKAGNTNSNSVISEINRGTFYTPLGQTEFNKSGDIMQYGYEVRKLP